MSLAETNWAAAVHTLARRGGGRLGDEDGAVHPYGGVESRRVEVTSGHLRKLGRLITSCS